MRKAFKSETALAGSYQLPMEKPTRVPARHDDSFAAALLLNALKSDRPLVVDIVFPVPKEANAMPDDKPEVAVSSATITNERGSKPAYKKASREQIAKIIDLLRENCTKDEDGFAVFAPGWNDRRIAAEVGLEGESAVAEWRRTLVGNFRGTRTGAAATGDERLARLEGEFARLMRAHNDLCEAIGHPKFVPALRD